MELCTKTSPLRLENRKRLQVLVCISNKPFNCKQQTETSAIRKIAKTHFRREKESTLHHLNMSTNIYSIGSGYVLGEKHSQKGVTKCNLIESYWTLKEYKVVQYKQ